MSGTLFTAGMLGDLSLDSTIQWNTIFLIGLQLISLVFDELSPLLLSCFSSFSFFFFFFDVLIWIHQSFALLLCLKLRVKHGSHPSCFSRELLFLTFCLAVAAWLIGSPKPLFELRWWVSCPIHKLCYNSRWLVPQKISSVEDKRETWPAAGMGPRSPNRASIAWGRQAQKKKNI